MLISQNSFTICIPCNLLSLSDFPRTTPNTQKNKLKILANRISNKIQFGNVKYTSVDETELSL